MKKVRNNALANGIAIGIGISSLFMAWTVHNLTGKVEALEGVTVLGGWPLILACVAAGIVLVAMGAAFEAYQRARIKPKER